MPYNTLSSSVNNFPYLKKFELNRGFSVRLTDGKTIKRDQPKLRYECSEWFFNVTCPKHLQNLEDFYAEILPPLDYLLKEVQKDKNTGKNFQKFVYMMFANCPACRLVDKRTKDVVFYGVMINESFLNGDGGCFWEFLADGYMYPNWRSGDFERSYYPPLYSPTATAKLHLIDFKNWAIADETEEFLLNCKNFNYKALYQIIEKNAEVGERIFKAIDEGKSEIRL